MTKNRNTYNIGKCNISVKLPNGDSIKIKNATGFSISCDVRYINHFERCEYEQTVFEGKINGDTKLGTTLKYKPKRGKSWTK